MPIFIEPTVSEVMRTAGIEAEGTWADWLDRVEKRYRSHEPRSGRGMLDATDILFREQARRGWPVVSKDPLTQAWYAAMRLDGTDHKLAEMFALRLPPMSNTDREFLEGHCNGNQFEKTPYLGDWYAAEARASGVDITGKVYISGLANRPGDPEAWVSGRGDLERVVRERGWACQGSSNIKAVEREAPADTDVAHDIVESRMRERVEKDPGLATKKTEDLYHETRDLLKPSWAA